MAVSDVLGLSSDQLSTLATLTAGYSGVVVLILTCLPFNTLRAALVILTVSAFVLAVCFLPGLFYLTPVNGVQWVLLAAAAVLAPLIQIGLAKLMSHETKHSSVPSFNA